MTDGRFDALNGVVAVTVTPFEDRGPLDGPAYTRVVRRMVAAGIRAVTANGNTGEFYSLTADEVDRAVPLAVEAAGDAPLVLAGVGHDVTTAIAAARSASRAGADAVMVHQPVHPYQSPKGWLAYHRAVAEAVPDTGVIPYVRNPAVNGPTLRALAEACSNVVAVKYAVPDVLAFAAAVDAVQPGRLIWICGLAEAWAPFFTLAGATGFTSGLAAIAPSRALDLHEYLAAGNIPEAMRVWQTVRPLEDLRARQGGADNVSAIKEALSQLGLCGRAVRPPSGELSTADREAVRRILATWPVRE